MDVKKELHELLIDPAEDLDLELKSWLDFDAKEDQALLAKTVIALANYGGGYIIIDYDDQTRRPCPNKPEDLSVYNQDRIQGIVEKYCDPPIQCRLDFVTTSKYKGISSVSSREQEGGGQIMVRYIIEFKFELIE